MFFSYRNVSSIIILLFQSILAKPRDGVNVLGTRYTAVCCCLLSSGYLMTGHSGDSFDRVKRNDSRMSRDTPALLFL